MLPLGRLALTFVFGLTWIIVEGGFAPALPTGRRTQFYYRYDDGAYKYGYDTGEGSYSKAVASPDNEVQGDYAYDGPGGRVDVKYTAGKGGFLPDGHPSSNVGVQLTRAGDYSSSQYYEHDPAEEQGPADASYSFGYNVGDQSRQEVSDPQGNVQGSYTFVSKDGSTRKIDYEAGAEKGFVVKGNVPIGGSGGPQGYSSQGSTAHNPDGSYAFSYTAGDHTRHESADANGNVFGTFSFVAKDDGLNRQVNYEAGAEKGFIASGSHLPQPVQPTASIGSAYQGVAVESARIHGGLSGIPAAGTYNTFRAGGANDGSSLSAGPLPDRAYQFSYNAGDHTRQETSDANGNVVGSFSFIAKDDKINRKVDYVSGADQGFVAFGSHLPVPPVDTNAVSTGYSAGQPHFHAAIPQQPIGHSVVSHYHSTAGSPAPDGSYSFSYNAGDHSRTESSDAHGNVVGSFSFTAKDDALHRKVDYEAGAEKGFIASGEHLPKSTSAHGAAANPYIGHIPVASVAPTGSTFGSTSLHGTTGTLIRTTHPAVAPPTSTYSSTVDGGISDGSYAFGFNAPDHSRQESSDNAGNVVGSYTFVSKEDGLQRKVNYEAGTKGFVATGEHLPLQPHVVAPEILISKPGDQDLSKDYDGSDTASGDASYSFSYNAGDHTRQESSDAFGNVIGSFSFVAKDDGLNRNVVYESGAEKGFIAKGSHLPVPVSADNAFTYAAAPSAGLPLGYSGSSVHHGTSGKSYFHGAGHSTGPYSGTAGTTSGFTRTYDDNRALVKTFLTPNAHHKFGYIYDTQ